MATQAQMTHRLKELFGDTNVISEWSVAKNTQDELNRRFYCPRIDIAVGPFNIDKRLWQNNARILDVYYNNRDLIDAIKRESDMPEQELKLNENPRCLMAIEIENRTGPKHRIGSIMNASAIGKIGIIVTNNEQDFQRIVKIREYLEFLLSVGKTKYNPKNVMTVLADSFYRVLNETHR